MILRNCDGLILKAWVNHFVSDNPFCAEAEAALQAFKNVAAMNLDDIEFEGDAFSVIMALHGLSQFPDWRASHLLLTGQKLLQLHCHWSLRHIYREANACAHNLTKWAESLHLSGSLDVTTLPPTVWCDRGGT